MSAAGLIWAEGGTATATAAPRALAASGWLSGNADTAPIQRLMLPGTHGSGARYGGPWTGCQKTANGDQLNSGMRFVEIRCRICEGAATIYHDAFDQNLNFDDVLGSAMPTL